MLTQAFFLTKKNQLVALLRILVVIGGVAGGILFFFKQLAGSGQWRKGIVEKDLNLLKESIRKLKRPLVDIDDEELPLLSLKQKRSKVRMNSKKLLAGTFQSIYEENLVSYSTMTYQSGHHLIVAQTSDQEFVYRLKNKNTDVYVNGSHIGQLNDKGELIHPVHKNIIARIDNSYGNKFQVLTRGDDKLASILNPLVKHDDHERVLNNIEIDREDDRLILLSLTFLNMIERTH